MSLWGTHTQTIQKEIYMGSLCDESYSDFLDSLKAAGIEITNEAELRERLAETYRWRYAFMTLATNGRAIGISFNGQSRSAENTIRRALDRFQFPEQFGAKFVAHLGTEH